MKISHLLLTLSFGTSLLLATPAVEQQNKEITEVIKLGKESAAKLAQTLGKNMKAHMKSGGPLDALSFCSNEAYDLTASVNKTLDPKVKVKRVSTNYRSAANMPSQNEKAVLNSFEELQKSGAILPEYIVQKVAENEFKFYKPIIIDNGVCLKCHGNLEEGKLKTTIKQRYPDDKAVGYTMNDLRGAIIVDIKTK